MRIFTVFLVLCGLLSLAACGFSPLYARPTAAQNHTGTLDSVTIDGIPDRSGQYLRNALMDRFYSQGRPVDARYELTINPIKETHIDLDLTKDATVTRQQISLSAHMTLKDLKAGGTVFERDLTATNSFNVLLDQYDTKVSEQYVRENALDDMARQIEAQLALYFKRTDQGVTTP